MKSYFKKQNKIDWFDFMKAKTDENIVLSKKNLAYAFKVMY